MFQKSETDQAFNDTAKISPNAFFFLKIVALQAFEKDTVVLDFEICSNHKIVICFIFKNSVWSVWQIFRTKQSLYGLKLVLANSLQIHHGNFYIKQFLFK